MVGLAGGLAGFSAPGLAVVVSGEGRGGLHQEGLRDMADGA